MQLELVWSQTYHITINFISIIWSTCIIGASLSEHHAYVKFGNFVYIRIIFVFIFFECHSYNTSFSILAHIKLTGQTKITMVHVQVWVWAIWVTH